MPKEADSLLMSRNTQAGYARQFDLGHAAVEADMRVAAAGGNVAMGLQIGQRVALKVELILAMNEVRYDVLAACTAGDELEGVVSAAAHHRLVARATGEGVVTETALHEGRARPAHQRGAAAQSVLIGHSTKVRNLELPADNCSAAKGAVHRSSALLENRVMARAEVDRVVTADGHLVDYTRTAQRCNVPVHLEIVISATGDACSAHLFIPQNDQSGQTQVQRTFKD